MDNNQASGPAWDHDRSISRQSRANQNLAAPYTPPMPPMPLSAPPQGIFEELKMLEEMVVIIGKGVDHLGDRLGPVLTASAPTALRGDDEEHETADSYVVIQLRRMRNRLADLNVKLGGLEGRLQLP